MLIYLAIIKENANMIRIQETTLTTTFVRTSSN